MSTKVIFRKFTDGEIIALFPQIPANNTYNCMSYLHVGQHGAASPAILCRSTKPALPDEYALLEDELTQIGYDLKITKRFTYADQVLRGKEYCQIAS